MMQSAGIPTDLEKTLSYILSLSPIFGILMGIYYLTWPSGFKVLGRNCILISTITSLLYVFFEFVI